jgi:hypothetical protein
MAPRRRRTTAELGTFDPKPSLHFGAKILGDLKTEHALIGKVAMWYWLENPADHEYTKDVDFAVPRASLPALVEKLGAAGVQVRQLAIGGVNAMSEATGIRADFIDRSSEEWGDLQPLYKDAMASATQSEDRISGVPVASPEHLVTMKIGAATDKDERDAMRLIAKVEDLDVDRTRELVRKFLGPSGIGRFEECLRRAGHPKAKRAYTESS